MVAAHKIRRGIGVADECRHLLVYFAVCPRSAKHTAAGANRIEAAGAAGEVGGWGRDPFSRNLMSPTPRSKWYLTTGRRFH